jgi:hypothetical protein
MKLVTWGPKPHLAQKAITTEASLAMEPIPSISPSIGNPRGNTGIESNDEAEGMLFRPRLTWVPLPRK